MDEKLERILSENLESFKARKLNCAETVLCTLARYWGEESDVFPRIATAFGGGICSRQEICGALTGGLMAIGLKKGRRLPGDDNAPANQAGKALLQWAKENYGALDCLGLSGTDFTDPVQLERFRAPGGAHETVCERLVADVCRQLAETF